MRTGNDMPTRTDKGTASTVEPDRGTERPCDPIDSFAVREQKWWGMRQCMRCSARLRIAWSWTVFRCGHCGYMPVAKRSERAEKSRKSA